jgi:flagellar hook assembly protein FlgD
VDEAGSSPELARLHGTYPNPFNPKTAVSFSMESTQRVNISVYDMSGRRIAVLMDEEMPAGDHEVAWNGTDFAGNQMSSGVYLVRLHVGEHKETQSVVLMK